MHYRKILLIFISIIFSTLLYATNSAPHTIDESVKELNIQLAKNESYKKKKEERITLLEQELKENRANSIVKLEINDALFKEYKSYKYEEAYFYAKQGLTIATEIGDIQRIEESKNNIVFCYISSGLFKEAFDLLNEINQKQLQTEAKENYYTLQARLYYDMADYTNDERLSGEYRMLGMQYCDSVIKYSPWKELSIWKGMKLMQERKFEQSIENFQNTLTSTNIDEHTSAIALSCIGYMYWQLDDLQKGVENLAKAAILDIETNTKETVALQNIAIILYRMGDVRNANKYIRIAMEDANFYNARHRKIQISQILPIIEKERMEVVEKQRNMLLTFAIVVSLLFVLLLIATIIIYKQIKILRRARRTIQLQNQNLKLTNTKLLEVNEIKDEYIVQSLYSESAYLDRIEKLYRTINKKIVTRQYEDISSYVNENDLKEQRENMYSSFDQTFLRLFPRFIKEYNSLFEKEDKATTEKVEGLTTELRIFALIRLGISDSERIANFLDYSVNTINTYKTRVKNKSIVANEQFEVRIMEIKTGNLPN